MNQSIARTGSRVQFRGPCSRVLSSGLLAVDAVDFRVVDPSVSSPPGVFLSLSNLTPLLTSDTAMIRVQHPAFSR